MNNQEIQNELLQVQKEIAELPAGYISKKNINGSEPSQGLRQMKALARFAF